MGKIDFNKGLKISRNYDKRNIEDTKALYVMLQQAALSAKLDEDTTARGSIEFLVKMFEPYIIKIAKKIHKTFGISEEFADVLQDTYAVYLKLIYKYNEDASTYAYYIRNMLYCSVKAYAKKHYFSKSSPVDSSIIESALQDKQLSNVADTYETFNNFILIGEYERFIKNRALKKSKTRTVHEVCYRYFLGGEGCSQIAKDLNVTYHAIYSVVGKIKRELRDFFDKSEFTDIKYNSPEFIG